MDALQCPRCELRFATRNELEDHFAAEHPPADEPDPTGTPTPHPGTADRQ